MDKPRVKKDTVKIEGKLPPQAVDLEKVILGAILIDKEALTSVGAIIKPDSFYKESHSVIYRAILELYVKSDPIDILTVTQKLRKNGQLEIAGGAFYVTDLTTNVNSSANIESHARIVAEYAIKRDIIKVSSQIQAKCYDDTADSFEILTELINESHKINNSIDNGNTSHIKEILREVLEETAVNMNIPDGITGVPSGFTDIDRITGGWQNNNLIILAARPSMGKSAKAVNYMRNAAIDHKMPVAFFSLEMSKKEVVKRLLVSEVDHMDISTDQLTRGKINQDQFNEINKNINSLIDASIYIDDTSGLSLNQLRSKCNRLKSKHGIKLIIIDYLQLMTNDTATNKNGNREQEISSISRGLKNIAKDLDVPVIALSQLSRSVETRPDKRPILSDLRESGAIEQDADMVMFLFRPEYYGITQDEQGNSLKGIGECIIAKHRNGALDNVLLRFVSTFTKFYNMHTMTAHSYEPRLPYSDTQQHIDNFNKPEEPVF